MENNINCVKEKIEEIIKKSSIPEDAEHSKNTLEWLLKLEVNIDEGLKIAALGHDIERAIKIRKVKREDYKNYDEFKNAHALNSAKILAEIMGKCNMDKKLSDDILFLVRHHEVGGEKRVNLLKYADTISFFHVNLQYYFTRNSIEETKKRCLWGIKKLPNKLKRIVLGLDYQNKELECLVKGCILERK